MVQINFAQKEIQCKIVYYGPGMSGKTTNLELVHGKVPADSRGELTSIATTGERTLYFDYMPLDLGQIAGIRTKFQLYTVPGQIYYKSTRRLVLQGVDGIVFVADSSAAKLRENQESFSDLEENLKEMGKALKDVPIVVQYNKRDLPDAMPIEELEKEVNPHGFPYHEAIAPRGEGVFPTLKDLAGRVLESVNKGGLTSSRPRPAPKTAAVAAPAPKPAAPKPPAPRREPAMAAATTHATPAAASRPAIQEQPVRTPPQAARTAPAPAPARAAPHAKPQPKMAARRPIETVPHAPSRHAHMQDRVVQVRGLRNSGGGFARVLVVLGLAALIGGAIYFMVTNM